jgi:hypothetical protein
MKVVRLALGTKQTLTVNLRPTSLLVVLEVGQAEISASQPWMTD